MEVRYQLRYSPEWDAPEGTTASLRSDPVAHQIDPEHLARHLPHRLREAVSRPRTRARTTRSTC